MNKYKPTPRDLFNPPPQAREFSNIKDLEELRSKADIAFYNGSYEYEKHTLFLGIIRVLEDHELRIGVKP